MQSKIQTDYPRIINLNIKNMKHIYFTYYHFYIIQKLYICTINNFN
jgi:Tfp pilus assembly protein PilZ